MKIAVGCDQGGFRLKTILLDYLEKSGYECKDFGTYSEASVDYPVYALKVAESVASKEFDRGIIICGTGIGVSIVANKVPGIRCALCHDVFSAKATRQHNNTNILTMGGRVIGEGLMLEIVETWLKTDFEGGRHQRRIDLITEIEKKYSK